MRTDRQTDMTKLIVAFRNFTNTHKNEFVPSREQPHHQKDQYFRDVREMIGVLYEDHMKHKLHCVDEMRTFINV